MIHTEEENERNIAALQALHDKGHLTVEEEQFSESLTAEIEDFEEKHYQLEPTSPGEIIRELMDANGLKEGDMADVFGTKTDAYGVLRGEWDLSNAHIQALAERFRVSPEVFLPRDRQNG